MLQSSFYFCLFLCLLFRFVCYSVFCALITFILYCLILVLVCRVLLLFFSFSCFYLQGQSRQVSILSTIAYKHYLRKYKIVSFRNKQIYADEVALPTFARRTLLLLSAGRAAFNRYLMPAANPQQRTDRHGRTPYRT